MSNFWTISCLASALFVFVVSQRGDDINLEDLITMALNGSDPVLPSPTPVTSARPRGVSDLNILIISADSVSHFQLPFLYSSR